MINPKTVVFQKDNWNQDKYVYISANKDEIFQGLENYEVRVSVKDTKDFSYGFGIEPKKLKIKVLEDKQRKRFKRSINEIEVMSNPSGSRIKVDNQYLKDSDNNYILTPNTIPLDDGRRKIVLEKDGHYSVRIFRDVGKRPLGSIMLNLRPRESSITTKVPREYTGGFLFVNGTRTKQLNSVDQEFSIQPGDYTIQVKAEEFFSEIKTISIIPGEDALLSFSSFSKTENSGNLSGKFLGINNLNLGLHYESLLVKPSSFPLDKVSWGIPGGSINLEQDISSIKMFGSYGSGKVTPFLQSSNNQNLNIDSVSVINSGVDYGFHWGLPVRIGVGMGWTRFSFSSDDGDLNYSYFSSYLGLSSKLSQESWFIDGHLRFNSKGQGTMQVGVGFIP